MQASTIVSVRAERSVLKHGAISRAIVYGLFAALVALPAAVMLTVGAFRGLVLLEQGYTWAAWVTLGGIFLLAGAFSWTRRNP